MHGACLQKAEPKEKALGDWGHFQRQEESGCNLLAIIRPNVCVNTFHLIRHTISPYEVGLCVSDVKGLLGRQKAYA